MISSFDYQQAADQHTELQEQHLLRFNERPQVFLLPASCHEVTLLQKVLNTSSITTVTTPSTATSFHSLQSMNSQFCCRKHRIKKLPSFSKGYEHASLLLYSIQHSIYQYLFPFIQFISVQNHCIFFLSPCPQHSICR